MHLKKIISLFRRKYKHLKSIYISVYLFRSSTLTYLLYIPVKEEVQTPDKNIFLFKRKYKHLKNICPYTEESTSTWKTYIPVQE
jgi:hypothetical protein